MHPFDPASLHDPVALKTQWGPCVRGGSSSRTRSLVTNQERATFVATLWMKLAGVPFLLVGAVSLVVPFFAPAPEENPNIGWVVGLILFTVFTAIGSLFMYFMFRPIVVDRGARLFWKGYGERQAGQPGVESLKKLHALQVITERCVPHDPKRGTRTRPSFFSYELNLVFNDGHRTNLIDHGDLNAVEADGATLAEFLNVPLWKP